MKKLIVALVLVAFCFTLTVPAYAKKLEDVTQEDIARLPSKATETVYKTAKWTILEAPYEITKLGLKVLTAPFRFLEENVAQ